VSEKGTEASAATAIVIGFRSIAFSPEEAIDFTADRPFFYFIEHIDTSVLLFCGVVGDL
jgi:serpin B